MRTLAWTTSGLFLASTVAFSQQIIGTVAVSDATLTGTSQVAGGRATLVGASSIIARDHTADVALARGGIVRVCQTSGVTLTSGASTSTPGQPSLPATGPLMLALDRGAVELTMNAVANDIILTPDLRFAVSHSGPIDLRVRVTSNGDTCVEQRAANAPLLLLSNTFGETTYEIYGGQHLLFEHGNLREVVDHETSPCGCPEPARTVSLAEAALAAPSDTAAAQHPFPAAESAGLAPTSEIPQAAPGAVHTQVAATLGYEGADAVSPEPPPMPIVRPAPTASETNQQQHGFAHSLKRFFKRLFGGS